VKRLEECGVDDLPTPTGRELEILKVMWELGSASVRDVHERLHPADGEELAYNTVQTLMRIMESKKLVSHRVDRRTFVYTPLFSREESASRYLDRVFDGAASQLMLSLLRAEKVSADELERMQSMIAEARRKRTRE
jgi:BlaI family transcriptional regulator, penicillinase repressor